MGRTLTWPFWPNRLSTQVRSKVAQFVTAACYYYCKVSAAYATPLKSYQYNTRFFFRLPTVSHRTAAVCHGIPRNAHCISRYSTAFRRLSTVPHGIQPKSHSIPTTLHATLQYAAATVLLPLLLVVLLGPEKMLLLLYPGLDRAYPIPSSASFRPRQIRCQYDLHDLQRVTDSRMI